MSRHAATLLKIRTRCAARGRCQDSSAQFPASLLEFFVKLLTDEGDLIVDPSVGPNTAGAVAKRLGRRWVGMELLKEYPAASEFRFGAQRWTFRDSATVALRAHAALL